MLETPRVPSPETIRQQEMARFVFKAMRIRAIFVPIITLLALALVLIEPSRCKVIVLVVAASVWSTIVVLDLVRVRRNQPYPVRLYPLELIIAALMQSGFIVITGAMESPLLVIWIPLAMLTGVGLGPRGGRWLVIFTILALLWGMCLAGLYGLIPRTLPGFLRLDPGFQGNAAYVITKACIFSGVIVAASQVGAAWFGLIERMLEHATTARQHALEVLADRNRELVLLSSTIAHELKNPLASVAGLVQLLALSRGKADRQEERFQMLGKEVERMRHRLDELLNFSRPMGELDPTNVDPAQLMAQVGALHEGMARARGLEVAAPDGPPVKLACDRRKVKQALVNLLQNALEAAAPGGTVRWVIRPEGEDLLLGVQDSGPGLDDEILARAHRAGFTTKDGGSGVGLTVARGIAQQHGGDLVLQNLPEGGALAALRLPPTPGQPPEQEEVTP